MNIALLIFLGVLSRLVPHPANVTAVGGLAIFSGARLETKKAVVVTMGTMLLSDIVLGFHSVMWATYGSLLLAVLLGKLVQNKRSIGWIVGATLTSSILFYLITNFAVWFIPGSMYPKTLNGLVESYVMALPFFRNSVIGDLGYSIMFFSAYELVMKYKRIFSTRYVQSS